MIMINGEQHDNLCVGIDLGTTNSVLATITARPNGNIVSKVISIDRAVDMYSGADGSARLSMKMDSTLPSCVYYNEEKNFAPIVGNFAKSRYSLRPHLVAKSIKSQMGNPVAEGLSPNIPDKTPAKISSRILEHMLKSVAKMYRQNAIKDAVITVPASFDSIMCQATLNAAELAGITIHNANGSLRSILLPEPQAVIYDFMNQIKNGEISDKILDLSSPKNVMVFDLGGGTLDITLHKISRRENNSELLKIEDLAINRYTLLGGDDFDMALAKKMFSRYLEQFKTRPEIVSRIKREEAAVIPQFLNQAEELKIRVSMDHSDEFGAANAFDNAWGDEADNYPVGGAVGATGYAYDDSFTTQDLEKIWSVFMGNEFKFEDYKQLDDAAQKYGTLNIIFPILDVLKKCADKLGTDDFKIDAVIMNGGMSRFYMVVDRLKKFFGFDPIVALDPDQSVARGAAVYHYYLHKYAENVQVLPVGNKVAVTAPKIKLFSAILPDSLYLLTQGNRYEEIIKTGTQLPHESEIFTGFKLPDATNKISIPIARRNNDNSYSIIGNGDMVFPEKYSFSQRENFVAFTVSMNEQRIITMNAQICDDAKGSNVLDKGTTEIAIAKNVEGVEKSPVTAPMPVTSFSVGVRNKPAINPNNAMGNLWKNCRNFEQAQRKGTNTKTYSTLIKREKQNIVAAGNPKDFAEPFFNFLKSGTRQINEDFKLHCLIIGRKIGMYWTPAQKRRLADFCLEQLIRELEFPGFELKGKSVNTKIQAIYTLYVCASPDDLQQLKKLHRYEKLNLALLYTHAMTKSEVDWIYEKFKRDYNSVFNNKPKTGIQNTAHALGVAFRLGDGVPTQSSITRKQIVEDLCNLLNSRKLTFTEMQRCFVALGLVCDCRYENDLDENSLDAARNLIDNIENIYDFNFVDRFRAAVTVADKMIHGTKLNAAEEEFLLIKLDD